MKSVVEWSEIHCRWCEGETAYSLAQEFPVTRQGINKRARREGWQRGKPDGNLYPEVLPIKLGMDTPATRSEILRQIRSGAPLKVAAAAGGVSEDTLARWRKKDPDFADQVRQARAAFLVRHIGHIDAAGGRDWKASQFLVTHAPELREEFSGSQDNKIEIIINVPRGSDEIGPIIIEGSASS